MSETSPHTQSSCPGEPRSGDVPGIHVGRHHALDDVDGRDKPGHDGEKRAWQHLRNIAGVCVGAGLIAAAIISAWIISLGPVPLLKPTDVSVSMVDRNGRLLRAYAMPDGRWRLPATTAQVDRNYIDLLLAYEDKRFREHRGVDVIALGRAAWQFASTGHIVSGGSTITMQVARLLEPGLQKTGERSFSVKLRQIVRAVQLERELGKDQILELYLTLAPFGGNLEGVRAASVAYFGKEPRRLSLGEAALLVSLPQSPETRRLDRNPDIARVARDRVLIRVSGAGRIELADAERARTEDVPRGRLKMPMLAPHASEQARAVATGPVTKLTLDAAIQTSLEQLARDRAMALGPDISIGILAVDNASGDVLAHVGSPDFFDVRRSGQVDMTRAIRSPGSTLKPFIYGLAFEDGFVHPESLIDDRPIRYGSYAPENFDMTFQGTVSVRKALQMSLNVPAVALLDRVGASRLTARLTQAGTAMVLPKDETPGLAMGLGGVGLTLADLVKLYSGVARLGETLPLREVMQDEGKARVERPNDRRRLLDNVAAWHVGNVLWGTPPPENAPHNRVAFKTGTSYGYRDAWAIGFDGRMTIGVWVGRPDGVPVPGLNGRASAAPVLFDAFARTGKTPMALPKAPRGTLVASAARLPLPLKRFRPASELVRASTEPALRIQFPLNGSRLDLASGREGAALNPLSLKVSGGALPLTVMVNGIAVGELDARRQRMIPPPGPGFARLTVMDATGAADTVVVRIQ